MVVETVEGGSSDDPEDLHSTMLDDPLVDDVQESGGDPAEDPAEEYEFTGDMANDEWQSSPDDPTFWSTVVTGEDAPEHLQGPDTPTENAEEYLREEGWTDEEIDDAVPDGFFDTVTRSAGGLQDAGGDAVETVQNVDDWLPDWLPAAVVVLIVFVALIALRPYASIAAGVAN